MREVRVSPHCVPRPGRSSGAGAALRALAPRPISGGGGGGEGWGAAWMSKCAWPPMETDAGAGAGADAGADRSAYPMVTGVAGIGSGAAPHPIAPRTARRPTAETPIRVVVLM